MDSDPLVLHLRTSLRPQVVARRTREAYDSGRDVVWIATRQPLIRAAALQLGGWRSAYGTSMRLEGEGRTVVAFMHSDDGGAVLSYWPRRSA